MTERQNIEIDYCPKCRGVWLDRGELDKVIERSQREEATFLKQGAQNWTQPMSAPSPQPVPFGGYSEQSFGHRVGHHGDSHGSSHGGHARGPGGFLKRLFD
jgi:Zn-finger nucleic acid-binding protein